MSSNLKKGERGRREGGRECRRERDITSFKLINSSTQKIVSY